jgi:hypothetical protein
MNRRVFWKRAALFALVTSLLPHVSFCQNVRQQMEKEIARISTALAAKPDWDKGWKEAKPDIARGLKASQDSLAAGRVFVALEQLADSWVNFAVTESMLDNPDAVKQGLPGFEAEWSKADAYMKLREQRYEEGRKNSLPLAVRAIAETNAAESRTYYSSSRAYAIASPPGPPAARAGLNVLGAAKGSIEFAAFCESLHFEDVPSPAPLRSIAPELGQLETSMIAAYQPPRSIDKHPEFISMHSALKEAGDLDAAHLYAGALYKYLDALEMFETLNASSSGNTPTPEDLQKKVKQMRDSFTRGADSSLLQLFLERSENSGMADAAAKGPGKSEIQQTILTKIVPAYYAALNPQELSSQPVAKTITVTLVRWPYT